MALVKHHKVVAALPAELESDSIYYVRAGSGFDVYVTNSAGTVAAYPANYARTDDTRLTDAREWTASTVSQAEAEAGTATNRRAWTALRVFQAIAAWWAASAAKTKLDGIAAGATANATDAQLRDRATHTGTQAISTVSGLQTVLDGKINTTERGVSGGIPTLDEFARIPPSQLPSYVDDVLEYAALANFPATGEGGKIYIAINQGTAANPTRQYRWTGSTYAEINPSPGTTDALTEGSTNLYFSEHRVRNTLLTGLSLAVSVAVTAADTVLSAIGKLQAQLGLKAPLDSPALTGNPTAPTAAADDNDTSIATTAFVRAAMGLFGIGANTPTYRGNIDLPADVPKGWAFCSSGSGTTGTLPTAYGLLWSGGIVNDGFSQEWHEVTSAGTTKRRFYRSVYSGAIGPWQELWHTGNLIKQSSPTDTTPGALMAVGAFGVGLPISLFQADINSISTAGFFTCDVCTGTPSGYTSGMLLSHGAGAVVRMQIFNPYGSDKLFFRGYLNSWNSWRELFHHGHFDPATKQDISTIIEPTASRVLTLSDAGNYLRCYNSADIVLTVPASTTVDYPANTEITVRAGLTGRVTIAAAEGVGILPPAGGTLVLTSGMTVTLKRVNGSLWDVIGQTVPA